mmetsp:Transcript_32190/g.52554  ORF Transcript_32190/g.52554 Transcript_32190/m.52554 type:complete len:271 (-) Transcript_32190:779-1591(-)
MRSAGAESAGRKGARVGRSSGERAAAWSVSPPPPQGASGLFPASTGAASPFCCAASRPTCVDGGNRSPSSSPPPPAPPPPPPPEPFVRDERLVDLEHFCLMVYLKINVVQHNPLYCICMLCFELFHLSNYTCTCFLVQPLLYFGCFNRHFNGVLGPRGLDLAPREPVHLGVRHPPRLHVVDRLQVVLAAVLAGLQRGAHGPHQAHVGAQRLLEHHRLRLRRRRRPPRGLVGGAAHGVEQPAQLAGLGLGQHREGQPELVLRRRQLARPPH